MRMPLHAWSSMLSKLGKKAVRKPREKSRRDCRLESLEPRIVLAGDFYNPWSVASGSLDSPVAVTLGDGIATIDRLNKPAYNSATNARPIIEFVYTVKTDAEVGSYDHVVASIELGGVSMGTVDFDDDEGAAMFGFQVDASAFPSGRYNWEVTFV